MSDQIVGQEEQPVCKYHQTGYCKYRSQCPKYHSTNICKEMICKDISCRERHPRTCKYFSRNNTCKRGEWCAYAHSVNGNQAHLHNLEIVVKHLKEDVESLTNHIKLINQYHQKEIHEIKEHNLNLSNNMSEIMTKIMSIDIECREKLDDKLHEQQDTEEVDTKNQKRFECELCGYKCDLEMTLRKHLNTKHPVEETQSEMEIPCTYTCSLCDEKCQTSEKLADHIEDHLEEIRNLDVTDLKKGHTIFECNVCQYQTSNDDEVRKHLISHTKVSLTFKEKKLLKPTTNVNGQREYNIMDRYGDDGRPINGDSDDDDS